MKNWIFWCLWLILLGLIMFFAFEPKRIINPHNKEVDSLNTKIDSIYIINDSIIERIDTVYQKIKENNIRYEKDISNIVNGNSDENCKFFFEYIRSNKQRYDSLCVYN